MLSRPQGLSAAGMFMSMTKSNATIGNRSSDLPVCSAVPQPLRHRLPPLYVVPALESEWNYISFLVCLHGLRTVHLSLYTRKIGVAFTATVVKRK
jgi:hypothetical protein